MAFLKNDKLMMIEEEEELGGRGRGGGGHQTLHFLRQLLLKITSGLKNFPGYVF